MSPVTYPPRLEFLDKQKTLTSDKTWIGSGETDLNNLRDIEIETGSVIFISDYRADYRSLGNIPNASIICVSCSLSSLHNIINNSICKIRLWKDQYLTAADQSLHTALKLTAGFSSSPAVLLNPDYQVVSSSGMENSMFLADQLANTGTLPKKIIENIFAEESSDHLPAVYPIPNKKLSLYGQGIFHADKLISILILETSQDKTDIDFQSLCSCASEAIYRYIIPAVSFRIGTHTRQFREIWQKIMDRHLNQTCEIIQELEQLPLPVENFVHVIVVAFQNKNSPSSFILTQLREVFPDSNMTVYENQVIILKTHSDRCFELNLDTEHLTAILERHG